MLWEKISLRMKGFLFFIFLAPKYVHNQFPCKETLLFLMPFCTTLYTCNKLRPCGLDSSAALQQSWLKCQIKKYILKSVSDTSYFKKSVNFLLEQLSSWETNTCDDCSYIFNQTERKLAKDLLSVVLPMSV